MNLKIVIYGRAEYIQLIKNLHELNMKKTFSQIKDEYYQLVQMVKGYAEYCQNIGLHTIPNSSDLFTYLHHPSFLSLKDLHNYLTHCQSCPLAKNRKKAVPGEGNPAPILVFIGQSPGREESKQGKPFLGEAGQLLTKIISSIHLTRKEVYLTYAIKCPFSKNEKRSQQIIHTCRSLLFQELPLLRPKLICTLGPIATQIMVKNQAPLEELRGKIFSIEIGDSPIKVIPTYSPEYLLQYPQGKKLVWQDIQLIRKEYDQVKS